VLIANLNPQNVLHDWREEKPEPLYFSLSTGYSASGYFARALQLDEGLFPLSRSAGKMTSRPRGAKRWSKCERRS